MAENRCCFCAATPDQVNICSHNLSALLLINDDNGLVYSADSQIRNKKYGDSYQTHFSVQIKMAGGSGAGNETTSSLTSRFNSH